MSPFERKIVLVLATDAGTGYAPRIPRTLRTLVTIPLSLWVKSNGRCFPLAVVTLIGSICCAIWLSTQGAEILGQKDPGIIIIDEIAGFLVAYFTAPFEILLFRFFDIAKVFPASTLEKLPGGAGIVLDDVMAGIYTLVILRLILSWGL